MSHVHFANPEVLATLRREYEQKVERDSAALDELHLERQQLHAEELQWAQRHLLLVEKGAVIDAFHRGLLSQAIQEKLLADIDAQLLEIESAETGGADEAFVHHVENAEKGVDIWEDKIRDSHSAFQLAQVVIFVGFFRHISLEIVPVGPQVAKQPAIAIEKFEAVGQEKFEAFPGLVSQFHVF